jgi:hypothetical protein
MDTVSDTATKLSKEKLVKLLDLKVNKFKGLLVDALKVLVRLPSALYKKVRKVIK